MKKYTLIHSIASLIIILATFQFNTVEAQVSRKEKDHYGFSVSFGSKSNKISSDHLAIHSMKVLEEGASIGLLWGNSVIETKASMGFYYSASQVPHTVDLVNYEASVNLYPLSAFTGKSHKVEPYLTTGASANNFKFHGFYAGTEPGYVNYSISLEPYLGNLTNYFGSLGAGLEFNLMQQHNFVKLFTEVSYQNKLFQKSSDLFKNTHISNQLSFQVGLSVGVNRFSK